MVALSVVAVVGGGRRQRGRLLVVNGLHVFGQRRTSVKGRRTDGTTEDHLSDLHDVRASVLFRVSVRDVLEKGVGVIEVDVAVVAVVVGAGAAPAGDDSVSVFLFQLLGGLKNVHF